MAQVLRRLPHPEHADLILGAGDDAAVWRLDDDRALVATVDVITPIVDDARTWGRVAATNAVSDVYAMGARPLFGLNVVGWNHTDLGPDLLDEVLAGVWDVAMAGGWVIVGGHTIDDPQPKVGLTVVGEVDPSRLLTNDGLCPGDALILTKPLGVGVAATALKAAAAPDSVIAAATAAMLRTNADGAAVALACGASAVTDVTGFGLLGHLLTMVSASGVDAVLEVAAVPVLDGIDRLVAAGHVPGGTGRNLAWVREHLDAPNVATQVLDVLADPQTSGGLLLGVARDAAAEALERLAESGHDAAIIGVVEPGNGTIRLR